MKQPRDYYPDCPEPMLVSLARQGDRDAFQQLIVLRQSTVRSMFRRICGDLSLADDLAQQTFMQAFRQIAKLSNEAAFNGWLKKIGINIWLQHHRKTDLLRDSESSEVLSHPNRDEAKAVDIDTALRQLGHDERLCIVLNYQEGLSHGEISDALELPLGTVKSHISRAAKRLRLILSDYHEGGPDE